MAVQVAKGILEKILEFPLERISERTGEQNIDVAALNIMKKIVEGEQRTWQQIAKEILKR